MMFSKERPSVAVVMPCWNAEKLIARAVQSVLDQDYSNLEVIVVDDGSTDGSLEVIRSFGALVRWETGTNRGAPHARNVGLRLSTSEYVLFLDADDYLEGPLISTLTDAALANRADVTIGRSIKESETGQRYNEIAYPRAATRFELILGWWGARIVQTGGLLWRAEYLRSIGGWDERMGASGGDDVELALRAFLLGAQTAVAELGHVVYVDHNSDARLTRAMTRSKLVSELEWRKSVTELALSQDISLPGGWGQRFYSLARLAFWSGFRDIGTEALVTARRLGYRRHFGSRLHRITCAFLGLDTKEMLRRRVSLRR
jgi:GT2 family glycosyltransferase